MEHWLWRAPTGKQFDLLLEWELKGKRLFLKRAHIMPSTGEFDDAVGTLGRSGLQRLIDDLGQHFGADEIEIPELVRTSGKVKKFGPGVFPVSK
jgi:hypothetical protein